MPILNETTTKNRDKKTLAYSGGYASDHYPCILGIAKIDPYNGMQRKSPTFDFHIQIHPIVIVFCFI